MFTDSMFQSHLLLNLCVIKIYSLCCPTQYELEYIAIGDDDGLVQPKTKIKITIDDDSSLSL